MLALLILILNVNQNNAECSITANSCQSIITDFDPPIPKEQTKNEWGNQRGDYNYWNPGGARTGWANVMEMANHEYYTPDNGGFFAMFPDRRHGNIAEVTWIVTNYAFDKFRAVLGFTYFARGCREGSSDGMQFRLKIDGVVVHEYPVFRWQSQYATVDWDIPAGTTNITVEVDSVSKPSDSNCDYAAVANPQLCTCNVDVDECAANTDTCSSDATCTDTQNGFDCDCNDGYDGDGHTCTDINECFWDMHTCANNAVCTNTVGGFDCACKPGYRGDGYTCVDVDECSLGRDDCTSKGVSGAMCVNTVGSYECKCMDMSGNVILLEYPLAIALGVLQLVFIFVIVGMFCKKTKGKKGYESVKYIESDSEAQAFNA